MIRIHSLDKTWVFRHQPAIGFRKTFISAMAIIFSETEDSINTMGFVHTAGDAHALQSNAPPYKSTNACNARGIISLPIYILPKKKNQQTQRNSSYPSANLCFSFEATNASPQDWQCLARILTLSTNPLIRSSY